VRLDHLLSMEIKRVSIPTSQSTIRR